MGEFADLLFPWVVLYALLEGHEFKDAFWRSWRYRRPMMSILQEAYKLWSSLQAGSTFGGTPKKSSWRVGDTFGPVSTYGDRTVFFLSEKIYATDASDAKGAVVSRTLSPHVARALWRTGWNKGGYVRMLARQEGLVQKIDEITSDNWAKVVDRPVAYRFHFIEVCGGAGKITREMARLGWTCGPVGFGGFPSLWPIAPPFTVKRSWLPACTVPPCSCSYPGPLCKTFSHLFWRFGCGPRLMLWQGPGQEKALWDTWRSRQKASRLLCAMTSWSRAHGRLILFGSGGSLDTSISGKFLSAWPSNRQVIVMDSNVGLSALVMVCKRQPLWGDVFTHPSFLGLLPADHPTRDHEIPPPCMSLVDNIRDFDSVLEFAKVQGLARHASNWIRLLLLVLGGSLPWWASADSWRFAHLGYKHYPFLKSARSFKGYDFDSTKGFPGEGPWHAFGCGFWIFWRRDLGSLLGLQHFFGFGFSTSGLYLAVGASLVIKSPSHVCFLCASTLVGHGGLTRLSSTLCRCHMDLNGVTPPYPLWTLLSASLSLGVFVDFLPRAVRLGSSLALPLGLLTGIKHGVLGVFLGRLFLWLVCCWVTPVDAASHGFLVPVILRTGQELKTGLLQIFQLGGRCLDRPRNTEQVAWRFCFVARGRRLQNRRAAWSWLFGRGDHQSAIWALR